MKIVKVEWLDSYATSGWQGKKSVDLSEKIGGDPCVSVGFLIHAEDKGIVLAQSMSDACYSDRLTIPRFAVTAMTVLGEQDE